MNLQTTSQTNSHHRITVIAATIVEAYGYLTLITSVVVGAIVIRSTETKIVSSGFQGRKKTSVTEHPYVWLGIGVIVGGLFISALLIMIVRYIKSGIEVMRGR